MNIPDLCPACCTELPADYPFDHVAIDLALKGDTALFVAMDAGGRREVVLTGLARGMKINAIATALSWPYTRIQNLLPDEHPLSAKSQRAEAERVVRELWERGLPDTTIHLRTGLGHSLIGRTRKQLGLATHRRSNAEKKAAWA